MEHRDPCLSSADLSSGSPALISATFSPAPSPATVAFLPAFSALIAITAAFFLSSPVHAQTAVGTVKRVEGQPALVSASTAPRQAEVGSSVYEGDKIVTKAGGAAGITMTDGTQLSVGPNSDVALDTYKFDSTTRQGSMLVSISRGAMRMISGLLARQDPRSVAVNTPTTTIGIRGTDFVVDVGDPAVR
jgi:hypothetical protein